MFDLVILLYFRLKHLPKLAKREKFIFISVGLLAENFFGKLQQLGQVFKESPIPGTDRKRVDQKVRWTYFIRIQLSERIFIQSILRPRNFLLVNPFFYFMPFFYNYRIFLFDSTSPLLLVVLWKSTHLYDGINPLFND